MDDTQAEQLAGRSTAPFILKEKIYDMMKYGDKAVAPFSWRDRRLADEIKQSMLTMFRLSVIIEKRYYKKTTLQDLDTELDVLRHLIRKAQDKDFYNEQVPKRNKNGRILKDEAGNTIFVTVQPPLPPMKYKNWSVLLNEIGKIIGGLLKVAK